MQEKQKQLGIRKFFIQVLWKISIMSSVTVVKIYCYFILNCIVNLFSELIKLRFVASLINNVQRIYKYWFCHVRVLHIFISLSQLLSMLLRWCYLSWPQWIEWFKIIKSYLPVMYEAVLSDWVFCGDTHTALCYNSFPLPLFLDMCPIVSTDLFIGNSCLH